MRKFSISILGAAFKEINANEYSVTPKTGGFPISYNDETKIGFKTSGKGKSSVNNYYLYFRDANNALFYTRISEDEFAKADTAIIREIGFEPKGAEKAPESPESVSPEDTKETEPVAGDAEKLRERAARANAKREARRRKAASVA